MSLKLNSSGGGSVTLQEPSTASNVTLTLPATTGTVLTNTTAGAVLQVVQTVKTNVFSSTSTSFTDITGLSVSITPTSASSKIMVLVSLTAGSTPANNLFDFILRRNSTNIYVGDTRAGYTAVSIGGGRGIYDTNGANTFAMNFLDSPATTSATTYSVQGRCEGGTFRVNASGSDGSGSVWSFTAASSITVMEIAG